MGAWGTGIFSNDSACDVRDDFRDLIAEGVDPADATRRLVEQHGPDRDHTEGEAADYFWLPLAAVQWKLGRLQDDVKERALRIIEEGTSLRHWEAEAPAYARRRRAALEKLRQQILSPQPPARRVRPEYVERSDWEAGDVWSYRLLSGRLILLRVRDTIRIGKRDEGRVPVVEIVDWTGVVPPPPEVIASLGWKDVLPTREAVLTYSPHFELARSSKRDYPTKRLELVAKGLPISGERERFALVFWDHLDEELRKGFGLE